MPLSRICIRVLFQKRTHGCPIAALRRVRQWDLGGSAIDVIHAVATDGAGNVYLTGATTSADFPVTAGAFQSKQAGSPGTMFGLLGPASQMDAFVVKLNPSGKVVYATFLGGVFWEKCPVPESRFRSINGS